MDQEGEEDTPIRRNTEIEDTNTENSFTPVTNTQANVTINKKIVSSDLRKRVFDQALEGKGNLSISRIYDLPRTTVGSIVKNYFEKGQKEPKKRGGNRRGKLTDEHKEEIRRLVDENCLQTLREIREKVIEKYNILASVSCINRCLSNFHYTIKNLVPVPAARNTDSTIESRFQYAQNFRRCEQRFLIENFLFIDEVGFKVSTRPKRVRSVAGTNATTTFPRIRTRNISVIAVMNRNQMILHKIHDQAVNSRNFQDFIDDLKDKCIELHINEPVLIMDNARIHHSRNLSFEGFEVLYLPPYCPFLNPIENCFSKWKNLVIRKKCENEARLKECISDTFLEITRSDCNGYYMNMISYLQKSENREVIET